MTRVHLLASGSMAQTPKAAQPVQPVQPDVISNFDLLEAIEDINTTYLRNQVLSTMVFSAKGYITAALNKLLIEFYAVSKLEGAPVNFETYGDCLRFVESIDFNTQQLEDAGMDTANPRQRLVYLVDMCLTMHALIKAHKGDSHVIPRIEQIIRDVQPRKLSKTAASKIAFMAEDEAEGDAELQAELTQLYIGKAKQQLEQQIEWDRNRVEALVQIYKCMDIREDVQHEDPFTQLDALTRFKMLNTCTKAIDRAFEFASRDDNISMHEFACMRREGRALKQQIEAAKRDRAFADLDI